VFFAQGAYTKNTIGPYKKMGVFVFFYMGPLSFWGRVVWGAVGRSYFFLKGKKSDPPHLPPLPPLYFFIVGFFIQGEKHIIKNTGGAIFCSIHAWNGWFSGGQKTKTPFGPPDNLQPFP